jgi:hypothetical protein
VVNYSHMRSGFQVLSLLARQDAEGTKERLAVTATETKTVRLAAEKCVEACHHDGPNHLLIKCEEIMVIKSNTPGRRSTALSR